MVKAKFFGILKSITGREEIMIDIEEPSSVKEIINRLKEDNAEFEKIFSQRNIVIAVNQEVVDEESSVGPGDEIAFLPPVSGG